MQYKFLVDTVVTMNLESEITTLLERLGRISTNDQAVDGLNPVQWEALRYFAKANRFSCTPSGLTVYLAVSKGSVSQTIAALERKGLIRKARNPTNRRSVGVELTAKGSRALANDPRERMKADLKDLKTTELKSLRKALSAVVKAALKARDGLQFGICHTCEHYRESHEDGAPHYCSLLKEPLSQDDSELICREHA